MPNNTFSNEIHFGVRKVICNAIIKLSIEDSDTNGNLTNLN